LKSSLQWLAFFRSAYFQTAFFNKKGCQVFYWSFEKQFRDEIQIATERVQASLITLKIIGVIR